MAITPTISRSRQNNFVDARKKEDDIKSLIENGSDGDHITLHAGDFSENNLEVTTPIYIPEDVYITVLNGATLEATDPNQPSDPFPLYDIFTGHIENIADIRQTSWNNFEDRAVHALRSASSIDLNDAQLKAIEIDGPGPEKTFSVNKNSNGDVKVGDLEKNKLAYATTDNGKLAPASDLNYNGSQFDVNVSTRISESLKVEDNAIIEDHMKSGTASAKNLSDNRIVVADTRLGRPGTLVDYSQFTFDGSNLRIGTNQNRVESIFSGSLLLNKNSSNYQFYINPDAGGVIEGALSVNKANLDSSKAFQIEQDLKDTAFYTKTNSSKSTVWSVENENEEILHLSGDGLLEVSDFKVYNNYFTINEDSSAQNAGLLVNRGSKNSVDLRWNESSGKWEFTNDGNVYQEIGTSDSFSVKVIDDKISGGSSKTLDLSNIFSSGTTTDQTILSTFVKDETGGSPTQGEYINAHGVSTAVRRSGEYEVYNEESSSLEFRFVVRKI